MEGLPSSPALAAVNWILRGVAGEPGWGTDAAAVLSPAFTVAIQPLDYPPLVSERARSYAPLRVLGIDVEDSTALTRISDHRGGTTLLSCTVEDTAPHRIISTWFQPAVPTDVAPDCRWTSARCSRSTGCRGRSPRSAESSIRSPAPAMTAKYSTCPAVARSRSPTDRPRITALSGLVTSQRVQADYDSSDCLSSSKLSTISCRARR